MITNLIASLVLGIVQGITEFLPVSSTGHLILMEKLLGISQNDFGLSFDASLHLGTLLAVFWFFKNIWLKIIISLIKYLTKGDRQNQPEIYLIQLLAIATIPGAVLGILLESKIETIFRSPLLIGCMLILFSLVLIYVEKVGKKIKVVDQMKWKDSLIIGLSQAVALIPGVSRSGITIAAGMWQGLTREQAAKFAFLLSAPIIAGAGGKKLFDVLQLFINNKLSLSEGLYFLIGIMTAAIFGYLTIKFFIKYLNNHSLYPFIFYRIILGLLVIIVYLVK